MYKSTETKVLNTHSVDESVQGGSYVIMHNECTRYLVRMYIKVCTPYGQTLSSFKKTRRHGHWETCHGNGIGGILKRATQASCQGLCQTKGLMKR